MTETEIAGIERALLARDNKSWPEEGNLTEAQVKDIWSVYPPGGWLLQWNDPVERVVRVGEIGAALRAKHLPGRVGHDQD